MNERTKRLVVALSLVAAGAVGALIFVKLTTAADDENPIRVRNKTLEFESEASQAEWVAEGATKYRLKKNKRASDVFEVNAFGSSDCLTPLNGISVQVVFQLDSGGTRTFTFTTDTEASGGNKKEPIVDVGNVPMAADNTGYKKKLRTNPQLAGHITEITVSPQSGTATKCTFPAEPRVLVELCRGTCS
jgi:hypothetical protein